MLDADAGAAGGDPERRAAADRVDLRLRDRHVAEQKPGRLAADHAEIGQVGGGIADQEVVDVVLARVDAGGKRGPRRRRLRRVRGAERIEAALIDQPLEVGQLAVVDQLLDQIRVHAVEAEDDHLLPVLAGRRFARAERRDRRRRGQRHEDGGHRHDAQLHGKLDYSIARAGAARGARPWYAQIRCGRSASTTAGSGRAGALGRDRNAGPAMEDAGCGRHRSAGRRARARVEALAAESDGLSVIVIGLPRRLSGEANEQTAAVEALARGSEGTRPCRSSCRTSG